MSEDRGCAAGPVSSTLSSSSSLLLLPLPLLESSSSDSFSAAKDDALAQESTDTNKRKQGRQVDCPGRLLQAVEAHLVLGCRCGYKPGFVASDGYRRFCTSLPEEGHEILHGEMALASNGLLVPGGPCAAGAVLGRSLFRCLLVKVVEPRDGVDGADVVGAKLPVKGLPAGLLVLDAQGVERRVHQAEGDSHGVVAGGRLDVLAAEERGVALEGGVEVAQGGVAVAEPLLHHCYVDVRGGSVGVRRAARQAEHVGASKDVSQRQLVVLQPENPQEGSLSVRLPASWHHRVLYTATHGNTTGYARSHIRVQIRV